MVEDVHWSDEATLDALRFLARRIGSLPAVLVLTYRDDELDRDHPLARMLGDVQADVRHIAVRRLSPSAVGTLAGERGLDPDRVFALTRGIRTSSARSSRRRMPRTCRARSSTRSSGDCTAWNAATRGHVEQLAVIPSAVPSAELARLVSGGAGALDAAEERGLLTVRPDGVQFRHELTRRAVVDALSVSRRIELNARVLAMLRELDADAGRIVAHAVAAGDVDAVVQWAPRAARDASVSGAHRQAAAHYRAALEHADRYDPAERVELMQEYAIEVYTLGGGAEAADVQTEVIRLRREQGDASALGASLRWASRFHWIAGDRSRAEEDGSRGIRRPDRLARPRAVRVRSEQRGTTRDAGARRACAIELAAESRVDGARCRRAAGPLARAHQPRYRPHAGEPRRRDPGAGGSRLRRRFRQLHGRRRPSVRQPRCWSLLDQYRLDLAEHYLEPAMEQSQRAEVIGLWAYQQVERARLHLARAQWDDAVAACSTRTDGSPPFHCVALTVKGLVGIWPGRSRGEATLDEAWEIAVRLGEWQRTGPVATARAEAALLRGDLAAARAIALPAYDEAVSRAAVNQQAELALYLRQAGEEVAVPDGDHPFAVQARGELQRAAGLWRERGAPITRPPRSPRARTSPSSSKPSRSSTASGRFRSHVECAPGCRELGTRSIPRGPSTATRHNPAGLTGRQVDVLRLLAAGLTNAEIADRLVVSVRTVDSHVAAIFTKLGVSSRQDAARLSADLLSR